MTFKFNYAKLNETKLWKYYEDITDDESRRKWIKDVYAVAVSQLTAVRDTFSNYTLHDETHVINVMETVAGLLGSRIRDLTTGETELLILTSCLHDVGMIYTPEDKAKWLKKSKKCNEFIRKSNPELMDIPPQDWDVHTKQNYFRWLHPFRVSEVLAQPVWTEIFNRRPKSIISKQSIIDVCQAHGEELSDIELTVSKVKDVDMLFCAMMLRLGDLLDFDDSRAPYSLYSYAENNLKSQEEWDKHQASVGFNYPEEPSTEPLPYAAECKNPGVEYSVRSFLKWVDEELSNYRKMQNRFHKRWRDFPVPYEIDKEEIESVGYESDSFKLTMEQKQIINLLTGEHLYDSNDVFVRELLQNSIDATLLRGKMDPEFQVESDEARIDLWEWCDSEGKIWFRIDDRGIGMTKGMLQRYFLKIGNSYYDSNELKSDMRDHGREKYTSISRFGIGFLSCFLCGEKVQVSTLYFDDKKSRRENRNKESAQGYAIRMDITGLTGYYVVQNQASGHAPKYPIPAPPFDKAAVCADLEEDNYRQEPGTSIFLQIDPGRLGGLDLRKAAQKYLCCPQMPVYYNGERIGETYKEFMKKAQLYEGTFIYDFPEEEKSKYKAALDGIYKNLKRDEDKLMISAELSNIHYPRLAVTVMPFDLTRDHILDGFSGITIKYELLLDNFLFMNYLKSHYTYFNSRLVKKNDSLCADIELYLYKWNIFPNGHLTLTVKLDHILNSIIEFISSKTLSSELFEGKGMVCAYHGIFAGAIGTASIWEGDCMGIFFLEDAQRPNVDMGRTKVSALQLSSTSAISCLLKKINANAELITGIRFYYSLEDWRTLRESDLGKWISGFLNCNISSPEEAATLLQKINYNIAKGDFLNEYGLIVSEFDINIANNNFILAYLQDTWEMTIDYSKEQKIEFSEKINQNITYDLFPPMMFCKAADNNSHQYLCSGDADNRKGITADHPYCIWLLKNASTLSRRLNHQFMQIVTSLCEEDSDTLIQTLNTLREQLCTFAQTYNIDMRTCPILTEDDFWHNQKVIADDTDLL